MREVERESGHRTPIIGLTAHAMDRDREKCLLAGMDEHLAKPFEGVELCATIDRLTSPSAPGSKESPATDLRKLLEGTGKDLALVRRLAQNFLDSSNDLMTNLGSAVTTEDREAVEFMAHRLRGSLTLFGASRADGLALRLEEWGRSGAAEDVQDVFDELSAEVQRVRADLSRQ